jgi:hypothetical protein
MPRLPELLGKADRPRATEAELLAAAQLVVCNWLSGLLAERTPHRRRFSITAEGAMIKLAIGTPKRESRALWITSARRCEINV